MTDKTDENNVDIADLELPSISNKEKVRERKQSCCFCNQEFSEQQSLSKHIASVHEGKKILQCTICDEVFTLKVELNLHMNSSHDDKPSFSCFICDKFFTTKYNLKHHTKTKHNGEKFIEHYTATLGTKETFVMPILRRNRRLGKQITAVQENKKPVTCEECQLSFSNRCSLNRHVRNVHKKEKPYRCELCQINFSQSIQLTRHGTRVHENDGKSFKLTSNFELKYHNEIVHEGKISHECKNCKAVFGRKSNFTRHVINIHEEKKTDKVVICKISSDQSENLENFVKPILHECKDCKSKFGLKCNLNRHIANVHERNPPHEGDVSELILSNQYLDKHIESVHEETERTDTAVKFKKCDKKFPSNRYLKVHKKKLNHEEKNPFECPKAHEVKKLLGCSICKASFAKKSNRAKHVFDVHGEKDSFDCLICDTVFTRKSMLKNHNKTVHGEIKPHKCSFCDLKFSMTSHLKSHIELVHKKRHS